MFNIRRHTNCYIQLLLSSASSLAAITLLWGLLFQSGAIHGIKLQPDGREKFYWSGEQFVITCQNNNNIKNVKMRWIGPNGHDLTEDRSLRVHTESAGPHGHRLIVMNASVSEDNGVYKCTLGGEGERVPRETIDFTLKIYKSINFMNTRSSYSLNNNFRSTLTCSVDFDQNAQTTSVSWLRDKKPIETYNDPAYSVISYNEDTQTSQLTIAPVTRNHEGLYTCRATAVTIQLSQIKEHDMRIDVQYAPIFDQNPSIVWVERRTSSQLSSMLSAATNNTPMDYPTMTTSSYPPSPRPSYQHQQTIRQRKVQQPHFGEHVGTGQQHTSNNNFEREQSISVNGHLPSSMVRVSLVCSCQANPPATIVWTSPNRSGQKFIMNKGNPIHILEQPTNIVEGQNTTSTLVVGYEFDPQWPNKQDAYTCLASNSLGEEEKKFSIAEGILPPAFSVGATTRYDPKTFLFELTILPLPSSSSQQQQNYIVPPVDMFRIRTTIEESDSQRMSIFSAIPSLNIERNSTITNQPHLRGHNVNQIMRHNNNELNHKNQVQYPSDVGTKATFKLPQNYSVSLSMLPSGAQKLYLEAHNAVGWSPNSTFLGDYYIVSGTMSLHIQLVSYTYHTVLLLCMLATLYHQSQS